MKCIISRKDDIDRYFNEITTYLDKYLITDNINIYKNYIYEEKIDNKWIIRIPGCSVGCIEVDDNNFIKNIILYDDSIEWYDIRVLNNLHKFYDIKLIMN